MSDKELTVVFTEKVNRTFATSPDIVFNIEFDKFLCDFNTKEFVIKDLGIMSFSSKEVAHAEKQMLYMNFPNQNLPDCRDIHQESYKKGSLNIVLARWQGCVSSGVVGCLVFY